MQGGDLWQYKKIEALSAEKAAPVEVAQSAPKVGSGVVERAAGNLRHFAGGGGRAGADGAEGRAAGGGERAHTGARRGVVGDALPALRRAAAAPPQARPVESAADAAGLGAAQEGRAAVRLRALLLRQVCR